MCLGIPIICSVGAPSSLAIELAESLGLTLVGFLKNNKMNIYSAAYRIDLT
ncbi:MAG: formate dehydrogenase accessory sulfurtransferase FdhD [Saprospiraceae bacterium]|nr:formate dehydrogenase accessory sulfurtransferase FdhD [Candidatus Vicinibacter affinis]